MRGLRTLSVLACLTLGCCSARVWDSALPHRKEPLRTPPLQLHSRLPQATGPEDSWRRERSTETNAYEEFSGSRGSSGSQTSGVAGPADPVAMEEGESAFDVLDRNHDGSLDREEFAKFEEQIDPSVMEDTIHIVSRGYGFWDGLINSIAMVIVTELGDKTFFIAAILAMRHNRWMVYIGAFSAVFVMNVLSVTIGFALPTFLPRQYTHYASVALVRAPKGCEMLSGIIFMRDCLLYNRYFFLQFLYFGLKLLRDAREMQDGTSEELAEVEEEFGKDESDDEAKGTPVDVEMATRRPTPKSSSWTPRGMLAPTTVLLQAFTATFVAEWGDRSQIATIAMSAAKDPLGVCIGGAIGHGICTALAVLGGRLLASRISERTVTIAGGVLFLIFAGHSMVVGP